MFLFWLIFLSSQLLDLDSAELPTSQASISSVLTEIEVVEADSGLLPIDCIYVINLDERVERWERMQRVALQNNLFFNRVSAVNGWLIPEKQQDEFAYPYPRRLRGGQLGCLLSHLSILNDAKKRNFNLIWVLEDDIEVLEDPQQLVEMIYTQSL